MQTIAAIFVIIGLAVSVVTSDLTYPQVLRYKQPSYYPSHRYAEPYVAAPRYAVHPVQHHYQPAVGYAPARPYVRTSPYHHPAPAYGYHHDGAYPAVHAYHPDAYATVSTVRQDDGYGNGVHSVSHSVSNGPGNYQTVYKKQQH